MSAGWARAAVVVAVVVVGTLLIAPLRLLVSVAGVVACVLLSG